MCSRALSRGSQSRFGVRAYDYRVLGAAGVVQQVIQSRTERRHLRTEAGADGSCWELQLVASLIGSDDQRPGPSVADAPGCRPVHPDPCGTLGQRRQMVQRRVPLLRVGCSRDKRAADVEGHQYCAAGRPERRTPRQKRPYLWLDVDLPPDLPTDLAAPRDRLQPPRGPCSARVRSGSSGGRAIALTSIRTASTVRCAANGRMPASAMTPW